MPRGFDTRFEEAGFLSQTKSGSPAGQSQFLRTWWLDLSLRNKGAMVIAVPTMALLISVAATLYTTGVSNSANHRERTVLRAQAAIGRELTLTLDAETGVRGYAATGDRVFLQPYFKALNELSTQHRVNETLVGGDANQAKLLAASSSLISDLLGSFKTTIEQVQTGVPANTLSSPAATSLAQRLLAEKTLEDQIRSKFEAMTVEENLTLASVRQHTLAIRAADRMLGVLLLLLGVLGGITATALFTRGIVRRIDTLSANAESLASDEPMLRPVPGNDELGKLSRDLERAAVLLQERDDLLRAARDDANGANLAKSRFLSNMSHELRTPLNAVLGFAQLLDMDRLSEGQQEGVDQILRAGRHLLDLITEILDISRIDTGTFSISLEPVNVLEVVREAAELVEVSARRQKINIVMNASCDDHVRADRQRLKQVLLNLLTNAVKYSGQGTTVTIDCGRSEERFTINVSDTGRGLNADQLDLIFQPFERLGLDASGIEGTGIGLTLARGFAEAMNGTLKATSQIGLGSTFTIELATATPDQAAHSMDHVAEPEPPKLEVERTVLSIEDNPSNVRLIESILVRRPSLTLVNAVTGKAGLDLARTMKPDLILLDLNLPDVSGAEVLLQLRNEASMTEVPVVVISADATAGQIRSLLNLGARDYLTKPIDVQRFLSVVDAVLTSPGPLPEPEST